VKPDGVEHVLELVAYVQFVCIFTFENGTIGEHGFYEHWAFIGKKVVPLGSRQILDEGKTQKQTHAHRIGAI
jgi:hypothetical protein